MYALKQTFTMTLIACSSVLYACQKLAYKLIGNTLMLTNNNKAFCLSPKINTYKIARSKT